jgi:hydroxymethylbilane synthase
MTRVKIGTRASELARWQTEHVIGRWQEAEPGLEVEIVALTTDGDDQADAPLEVMEGTGFFTSTLERALRQQRIDVAVHSFKDLPVESSPGLCIAASPPRGSVEDALCARDGLSLATLPSSARVGTSSARRVAQLRARRPDLEYVSLRGNVPTRLGRVERGELDAVVLARAGLERLGLAGRMTEVFAAEDVLPAPGQGALAVQVRANDPIVGRLARLDDAATRLAVTAEREVLHQLRGGCSVPVGAWAHLEDGAVVLHAGVFAAAGDPVVRVRTRGDDPAATGREAARELLARGAGDILAEFTRAPRIAAGGRT